MKLLIVDDEEHVREGIELSIEWEKHHIHQILMAENGLEALELVRTHQPEIIICDMSMHIMDGPTFLEKLREEGFNSKVIVLSGYQQFNYARATLLANGVDYLLKPFKINDLDTTIAKACAQVKEEQQKQLQDLSTSFQLNEANQLVKQQRFASIMEEDPLSITALHAFLLSLNLSVEGMYVATFLPRNKDELVRQNFASDEQLFNYALKNITKELTDPAGQWALLPHEEFYVLLLSPTSSIFHIDMHIERLQQAWNRTLRLITFAGYQKESFSADQLQDVLLEEKSTILNSNIIAEGKKAESTAQILSFIDKELVILEAVRTKNLQNIKDMISTFIADLSAKQFVTLRELQHYTVEINLLLMRIYSQLKDDRLHGIMPLWISRLDEWGARLEQIFSEMIEIMDYSKVDYSQHILAVRNYINDHMKEDITLASLAERFHFSPQYLAKRFKEEYNTTIIHYLTQLRMEKASSLLIHTDLSIHDIASQCGYEELNYFSKVFRKYYQLSPTSYRKNHKM